MLFTDDAAVATDTEEKLQTLMNRFSETCKNFSLTISLDKTNVLGRDVGVSSIITIDDYVLEIVNHTVGLRSAGTSPCTQK